MGLRLHLSFLESLNSLIHNKKNNGIRRSFLASAFFSPRIGALSLFDEDSPFENGHYEKSHADGNARIHKCMTDPLNDGSGLIVPPKTVSNVPPVAEWNVPGITVSNVPPAAETNVPGIAVSNVPPVTETNVPLSVATSRSFFGNHDYLCGVKPQQQ